MTTISRTLLLLAILLPHAPPGQSEEVPPFRGSIERLAPPLDALIAPETQIEVLATGFNWSEGPAWFGDRVVFSDVPENTAYQWKEGDTTATEFLKPSGLTNPSDSDRPQGSNGLAVDSSGRLILCQHGDRRVARLEADGRFTTLADQFSGRRLNSPNDLVLSRDGSIYFTDPPYGLTGLNESPLREMAFNGVYRISPQGGIQAVIENLSFPNGIALSPDETTLYVAVSDPADPHIRAYTLDPACGTVSNPRRFFDAGPLAKGAERSGSCDGLAVSEDGTLWATAPGGVILLTPDGEHLGSILTGQRTGNCTFGGKDGSELFITADMFLLRVKTKTTGLRHK